MPLQLTKLTFAAAPGRPGIPSTVTILVGPNNSGKSLALREIAAWAGGADAPRQVIDELDVEWPASGAEAEDLLKPFRAEPLPNEPSPPDSFLIAPFRAEGDQQRQWIQRGGFQELGQGPPSQWLRSSLSKVFTARLDGRTRFALMQPRPWQDLQIPPQHHLAALFVDDTSRQRVRELVAEAFPGRYFVVDPTEMQQFRVRVSDRPPDDPAEERNWDDRARRFHGAADLVESQSDGVVCFSGLVAAAISLPHRVLLVDEPEAFLHPPLARLLGSDLASLTAARGSTLVAATHSAEFLMGCIESGADTTIVRLTYEPGIAGARVLPHGDLQRLILDPLLRSTRALTGLFHRGVVVGESDHDRAFYDEINRRMTAVGRGAPDTFFTNAQNWQTIPRVIGPLRQLGVPAAAIVDLDTVAGPKVEWNKFYKAMSIDQGTINALEAKRDRIATALRAQGKDADGLRCKKTGIRSLARSDRALARELFKDLGARGVFVVSVGELEGWLRSLQVPRSSKAQWIVQMFSALGSAPKGKTYVTPGGGDVWSFFDDVGAWIRDPARLGLP